MSFNETFRKNHLEQGSGGKFEWNGKWYTTDRADGRDLRTEREARQQPSSHQYNYQPQYDYFHDFNQRQQQSSQEYERQQKIEQDRQRQEQQYSFNNKPSYQPSYQPSSSLPSFSTDWLSSQYGKLIPVSILDLGQEEQKNILNSPLNNGGIRYCPNLGRFVAKYEKEISKEIDVKSNNNNSQIINKFTVTWESEGLEKPNENSKFHSRRLHCPSSSSGVTIGRGYDLSQKTTKQIENDFKKIGFDDNKIKILQSAIGKKGNAAKKWLKQHENINHDNFINQDQQKELFKIIIPEYENSFKNSFRNNSIDWNKLDPSLYAIGIDFSYRGDNTPSNRAKFGKYFVNNDKEGLLTFLESGNMVCYPDRHQRRIRFLKQKK